MILTITSLLAYYTDQILPIRFTLSMLCTNYNNFHEFSNPLLYINIKFCVITQNYHRESFFLNFVIFNLHLTIDLLHNSTFNLNTYISYYKLSYL